MEYVRTLEGGVGGDISLTGGVEPVPVTRPELLMATKTSVGNVLLTCALRPADCGPDVAWGAWRTSSGRTGGTWTP